MIRLVVVRFSYEAFNLHIFLHFGRYSDGSIFGRLSLLPDPEVSETKSILDALSGDEYFWFINIWVWDSDLNRY